MFVDIYMYGVLKRLQLYGRAQPRLMFIIWSTLDSYEYYILNI